MSHEFVIPPDALARQKMLQEHVKMRRPDPSGSQQGSGHGNLSKDGQDEPHDDGAASP